MRRGLDAWVGATVARMATASSSSGRADCLSAACIADGSTACEVARLCGRDSEPPTVTSLPCLSRALLVSLDCLSTRGHDVGLLLDLVSDCDTAGVATLSTPRLLQEIVHAYTSVKLSGDVVRLAETLVGPDSDKVDSGDNLAPLAISVVVVALLSRPDVRWRVAVPRETGVNSPAVAASLASVAGVLASMYVVCVRLLPRRITH